MRTCAPKLYIDRGLVVLIKSQSLTFSWYLQTINSAVYYLFASAFGSPGSNYSFLYTLTFVDGSAMG